MMLSTLIPFAVVVFQATPEDCIKQFLAAYNKKDMVTVAKLTKGGKPTTDLKDLLNRPGSWPALTLISMKSTVSGDSATVHYKLSVNDSRGPQSVESDAQLTLSGKTWLVVPTQSTDRGMKQLDVLGVLAKMVTDPSALHGAMQAADQTRCLSNLKQVALSAIIFASDNNDTLKFGPNNAQKSLFPYLKNKDAWTCPVTKSAYTFNSAMMNVVLTRIGRPAETVLFYEGKNGKLNFCHNGKACVAFTDGHVKLVNESAAKALIWKP